MGKKKRRRKKKNGPLKTTEYGLGPEQLVDSSKWGLGVAICKIWGQRKVGGRGRGRGRARGGWVGGKTGRKKKKKKGKASKVEIFTPTKTYLSTSHFFKCKKGLNKLFLFSLLGFL